MGDRLRAGIPPWYVTKPTRSTQPCIHLGLLNQVPALIGWGKGGNVTSAGWQVTLCDPIWHVSFRSGVAKLFVNCYIQLHDEYHPLVFWKKRQCQGLEEATNSCLTCIVLSAVEHLILAVSLLVSGKCLTLAPH